MKDSILLPASLETPCYVYDRAGMEDVLQRLGLICKKAACTPLYSIKSANITGLLEFIKPYVAGFSCSSLFELQLAGEIAADGQSTHIATPGYTPHEFSRICALADFVSLNSISQWQRWAESASHSTSCGVRINPELSFVKDSRYDPCRPGSKLGITEAQLIAALENGQVDWRWIEGIHIHNNCESQNLQELEQTVHRVLTILSAQQVDIKWFNLGGGYLLNDALDEHALLATTTAIREHYAAEIFLEPGKAITGAAGYLVSTVIDIIEHPQQRIAILDTTINHLPEVFEYQYQPAISQASDAGAFSYRLAGSSCLSGDLFGDYRFATKLEPGMRIVFENVGAYMQVKANMFNGINLPASYLYDSGDYELIKRHDYDDFRRRL